MEIRAALPEDFVLVSQLNMDVQQLHAEAMPERFKPPSPDVFSRETFADMLADPDQHIYIAYADGEPAGYIIAEVLRLAENAFRYAETVLYIHQISVRPAHRRQGCGERLMKKMFDLARAQGIRRIGLDVWAFNTNAQAFFRSQGFETFNERMHLLLPAAADS